MSTTTTTITTQHPYWCDMGDENCGPDRKRRDPMHIGRLTQFYSEEDAAEVGVRLVHNEDVHPLTGLDEGHTHIRIALGHTEIDHEPFELNLTGDDALMLARVLIRYAHECGPSDRRLWGTFDPMGQEVTA